VEKQFYVYIMSDGRNGTLYVGVTSDLVKRTYQHKQGTTGGYSKKYGTTMLVYYELHQTALAPYPARETTEKMETRLENQTDRADESLLE